MGPLLIYHPPSTHPQMKTLENLILGDWGPTMRDIAWALGHAVAIPAAVLIVMAQWLVFTWRRPLAGALALVPVRRPGVAQLTRRELCRIGATETMDEVLTRLAADFGLTPDELLGGPIKFANSSPNLTTSDLNLTTSDLNKAGASIHETELGPMSMRMDFGMATTTPPAAPLPPVLAPAPRKQRRGSKRPQNPA